MIDFNDTFMKHLHFAIKSAVLVGVMVFVGCYPVSHIIVGETRTPISTAEVKIYLEYPDNYEIIARIDASSEFAFRDPSFDFTWQRKMNKTIERLKIEAASLGANGIMIEGTTNQTKQNVSHDAQGGTTSISESHFKTAVATAIYVDTI
ncbi:MAG: hypothetical protein CMG71_06345 [Candidatus Marinimicrobia bacterium]|nr:hypothetical protein [Candidatus Neomarinimicrobiota bacterium]